MKISRRLHARFRRCAMSVWVTSSWDSRRPPCRAEKRVKLATELSKRATGRTIYILDEPTTGLHAADVHKLIEVLQTLVDSGNTVVVIEHNLDVIKTADYIIDLGPEGGDRGGQIVATGTPEQVAQCEGSYTGKYLKKVLEKAQKQHPIPPQ